jgi:hypothetical protein
MSRAQKISYSAEELAWVKKHKTLARRELTWLFNQEFGRELSHEQLKSLCTRKGWSTGRSGKFYKGQPRVAGSGAKAANRTSFKKGSRPHNYLPVGSERITTDGYMEVKVADPATWKAKSWIVWEAEHNKPMPKNWVMHYRDGNNLNTEIGNLEPIPRALQVRLNQHKYNTAPEALKASIKLLAEVQNATGKLNKNTKEVNP